MSYLTRYQNLALNLTRRTLKPRVIFNPVSLPFSIQSTQLDKEKNRSLDISEKDIHVLSRNLVPSMSIIERTKQRAGYGFVYPQVRLRFAAANLFFSIQYQVDYDKFFRKLEAPDVMNSYCLITFFHVWLVSVALMRNDQSVRNYTTGLEVRRCLMKNMWTDIETRARKLNTSMNRKNSLRTYNTLNGIFNAFLFGFDEGLLGDDVALASAVWRHLFEMRELKDYSGVKDIVEYTRKNVNHLEKINDEDMFKNGLVSFIEFDQKEVDHLKVREKLITKFKARATSS